jgi:hypothetical protein
MKDPRILLLGFFALEEGADRLTRNVANELSLHVE